ncbi:hypothetical protein D3C80_2084960 [compost metagenome]
MVICVLLVSISYFPDAAILDVSAAMTGLTCKLSIVNVLLPSVVVKNEIPDCAGSDRL